MQNLEVLNSKSIYQEVSEFLLDNQISRDCNQFKIQTEESVITAVRENLALSFAGQNRQKLVQDFCVEYPLNRLNLRLFLDCVLDDSVTEFHFASQLMPAEPEPNQEAAAFRSIQLVEVVARRCPSLVSLSIPISLDDLENWSFTAEMEPILSECLSSFTNLTKLDIA